MAKRLRMLVVEDEEQLCVLYRKVLEKEGYGVEVAIDGVEGLEMAKKGGYDLILLDIKMPRMDGLEMLKQLNSEKAQKPNGPVVILTSHPEEGMSMAARSLGAAGFLIKAPGGDQQFVDKVKSFLGNYV